MSETIPEDVMQRLVAAARRRELSYDTQHATVDGQP